MFFSRSSSFAARSPSEGWPDEDVAGLVLLEEELPEDFLDEEDFVSSFVDDEDLASTFFDDEDLEPSLEDELSWDSEDSSVEGSAEVEELSSPHAANRNAEEIKKGRIFL